MNFPFQWSDMLVSGRVLNVTIFLRGFKQCSLCQVFEGFPGKTPRDFQEKHRALFGLVIHRRASVCVWSGLEPLGILLGGYVGDEHNYFGVILGTNTTTYHNYFRVLLGMNNVSSCLLEVYNKQLSVLRISVDYPDISQCKLPHCWQPKMVDLTNKKRDDIIDGWQGGCLF